ncbi:MAG TPA: hypothetical protein VEU72_03440 [Nitrosopumilaceae archaeon]|nr:hypothetical protein [Nitrosopumilaceae archaeon]
MKKNLGITLDEKILKQLDSKRGLVPRATIIEVAIRKFLKIKSNET